VPKPSPLNAARLAWSVLAFLVLVVLWGAYVRATGSGAGCGEHWPLCNGEILPRVPSVATWIEFAHRLTSGLSLILVLGLAAVVFRAFPRGVAARRMAALSVFFILTEALIGAGLVLLGWVAENRSAGRAFSLVLHLINTFLLLAAVTATALAASSPERRTSSLRFLGARGGGALLLGLILLAGVGGAIAALGDTLFPMGDLPFLQAVQADFARSSHLLVRLRVLHPFLAILAASAGFAHALVVSPYSGSRRAFRLGTWLVAAFGAQLGLGVLNVALRAPVWLQIGHLGVADVIWILAFAYLWEGSAGEPAPRGEGSAGEPAPRGEGSAGEPAPRGEGSAGEASVSLQ
jgi:heme A synthase